MGGYGGYGGIQRDTAGYSGIQRDTAGYVGYSEIRRDTVRYSRIQRDTAGYSGIQRDTLKTYARARVHEDPCSEVYFIVCRCSPLYSAVSRCIPLNPAVVSQDKKSYTLLDGLVQVPVASIVQEHGLKWDREFRNGENLLSKKSNLAIASQNFSIVS